MGNVTKVPCKWVKWVKDISQFNKDFIKNYNEKSGEEYFPEADIQYPEKLHELHNDLPFWPEIRKYRKFKNVKNLLLICVIKINIIFT